MDKTLTMDWVKLKEGGYMVMGNIPEKQRHEGFSCMYLTDLSVENIKETILSKGTLPEKLPVKSLMAYVRVNKRPYSVESEAYYVNPTAGKYEEIAFELARETISAIKREPKLREKFRSYVEEFERRGLGPLEARREALKFMVPFVGVKVRKWLAEEKLPKKLYLYCHKTLYEPAREGKVQRGFSEVRLYPVILKVIPEGLIRVERLDVFEKDIRVIFTIAYAVNVPESLPLDLITVRPPLAKDFKFGNYRYVYVGGYLYYGFERKQNKGSYIVHLSSLGQNFYTFIAHQDRTTTYELYIRLGYYGAVEPRQEISLWNPHRGDAYYTNTIIDENYTHKKLLKLLGIKTPAQFTFRIVSPEGYESDTFEVVIE